jgi:hypothetical protein
MIPPESDAVFVPTKIDASGYERPVSGFVCLSFDLKDLMMHRDLYFLMGAGMQPRED